MKRSCCPCAAIAGLLGLLAGCHSAHIDIAVENHTGGPVRLVEVDYPTASFGMDALDANRTYRYRVQLRGNGPLKVQYTAADGHAWQVNGPALVEGQDGNVEIVLLPGGKTEFHPQLTAGN
jgi:hypothetical protein